MVNSELKKRVDELWLEFWQGGIANPLTVIEQITYLMFLRLLDINETREENRQKRTGKSFKRRFADNQQHLRWSNFRHLGAEKMLPLIRDEVFAHLRKTSISDVSGTDYMKDAQLMIQKPSLLVKSVDLIEKLPLTEGDTKGDLYEYLLKKLTTAGINGQFRTPRHIISHMVAMMEPKPTDVICDPACGTGGFLVETIEYLNKKYSSPESVYEMTDQETGEKHKIYSGDLLEEHQDHIQKKMFFGFDFDASMLRVASMNLILHGIEEPHVHYQDTLSSGFTESFENEASENFDLILANPPFKGQLDFEDVHSSLLKQVKTKKTELLFVALILRMLKTGGRSATIVPDGVLFGSSNAHVSLRKMLVDHNQLEAVISLPSGVFKPYAGVSTGILVFTKGGKTEQVFFYDVENDGFSKDDKREVIEANDLPDCLERWQTRMPEEDTNRKDKAFFVDAAEIRDQGYDLSINRYKEVEYEEVEYDHPKVILAKLAELEEEIAKGRKELEGDVGMTY